MQNKSSSVSCGIHMQRWFPNWSDSSKQQWEQENKVKFSNNPVQWQIVSPPHRGVD